MNGKKWLIEVISERTNRPIDLFRLYVLFSYFRARDATLENNFFQISSYTRAYARMTYEKTKGEFP